MSAYLVVRALVISVIITATPVVVVMSAVVAVATDMAIVVYRRALLAVAQVRVVHAAVQEYVCRCQAIIIITVDNTAYFT